MEEIGDRRMTVCSRVIAFIGLMLCPVLNSAAHAQQEFPPPQGNGRLVVLAYGLSGPHHYTEVAADIAKLGYDVVFFDGGAEENTAGKGVKRDIDIARTMPHALPGKLLWLVSRSGEVWLCIMAHNFRTTSQAWWRGFQKTPLSIICTDLPTIYRSLSWPSQGGKDHFHGECCLADKDATLQQAAKSAGKINLI